MKINRIQLLPIVIVTTLSALLIMNNFEYRKYKNLFEKDSINLSNNITALKGAKTSMQTSLEKTIVNLQMEKLALKTNMDDTISELKAENERLKASIGVKKVAYLRPHDSIDTLSLQYGTKLQPSVGYMGAIKTFDFDSKAYTQVKVLETKEEWAKISMEAYIPKWYLVDKQGKDFKQEDIIHSINNKKLFTKEKCDMKLSPDEKSFTQLSLEKGKAVYVTKEYGNWYFIHLQQTRNNTEFSEGWVKKSQLGTINETVPLEAIIKKGTLIKEYYDTKDKDERVLSYDVPVYLQTEKNIGDFVYGKATDTWGFWINKMDIDFGYNSTK